MRKVIACMQLLVASVLAVSCSVMSSTVREAADPPVPFAALQQNPEAYIGRTVILGGYVLEVRNEKDATKLVVLQSPLKTGDEPGPRDASQGRFIAVKNGFLDPEIYQQDRKVTVAGTVTGSMKEPVSQKMFLYPVLEIVEVHLWEDEPDYRGTPFHYPYYDPWWPYYRPWWRHPYHDYPYYW
ncbi:MAG: Slp family lipoprotein [Desulfobacterales bacterium]